MVNEEMFLENGPAAGERSYQMSTAVATTETGTGFTAFLSQSTFLGPSVGVLLWVGIALIALVLGLIALNRSGDRQQSVVLSEIAD